MKENHETLLFLDRYNCVIMKTVFDLWMLVEFGRKGRPHYPKYKVRNWKLGTFSTFENAEKAIGTYLIDKRAGDPHSFRIMEVNLDDLTIGKDSLTEYLYDSKGVRIDERLYPNITFNDNNIYPGRTKEQCRFRKGDIVEVLRGGEISLAVIIGLPPGREEAQRINANGSYCLDDSSDCYTVLSEDDPMWEEHCPTLALFKPQFKIHPAVEQRLRKVYKDFISWPARQSVMNTTACHDLTEACKRLGWDVAFNEPQVGFSTYFHLILHKNGTGVQHIYTSQEKVYWHIDRVIATLSRLAGRPVEKRGYRCTRECNGSIWF